MKKIVHIFVLFLLIAGQVFGQNKSTKKADKYYENLAYSEAAKLYENLVAKDSSVHVLQRLGNCYYFNSSMEGAVKWYEKLFSDNNKDSIAPEYLFRYGQALRGVGNYQESDRWIKEFSEKQKEDARGSNFASSTLNLEDLQPKDPKFTLENMQSVNTEQSDYGAIPYQGGILFASTKPQSNFVKRRHTWNNRGFMDFYTMSINDSIEVGKQPLEVLNSRYHESSASFSPDGKTMYFTRNNTEGKKRRKDKKGITNLKIFKAEWIDDQWQNIMELPFNSDEYSIGHPAVSPDGKRLYFVSDMPGSVGQTDIFFVDIKADNTFGPIQTMSNKINTEGREMFPFVTDSALYFSSDGHFGLGGLDVFTSPIEAGDFQSPINMKAPVNSKSDDFAFYIDKESMTGYLSSNREGGVGDDDIYSFTYELEDVIIVKEEPCKQEISGIVVDKKFGVPLRNVKIELIKTADNSLVSELITGVSGKFSYLLPCNEQYVVKASKEYYKPDSNTFKTTEAMSLELDLDFDLGIVDDFVYNDRDELMIRIDPIFFDYNKADIRPDAAKELDDIVQTMTRYPKLIVESTSHTDARGKSRYNEILSDKRAKSTVRYIVSKGIDEDRISGNGYGETKLTNGCVDNDTHSNRVKCTKEEHQANRRSEFLITNVKALGIATKVVQQTNTEVIKPKDNTSSETHTVKSGETLYSIAQKYGLSVEQLKKLNNLSGNEIRVGQVLKIK